ncbi:hypothetical protein KPSA1_03450 [Pseudomonas syringae pv. actinidiae]|uniref:Uncharacterized protein n=1 Tax=Pseudomonas syringae pv. actinidiae TaxID=103796 RepID=A0A2V0QB22_PSESF|nr:hypothetical protein KPSA1_03450 [Pseudomonas syringae pv. actinidiae]
MLLTLSTSILWICRILINVNSTPNAIKPKPISVDGSEILTSKYLATTGVSRVFHQGAAPSAAMPATSSTIAILYTGLPRTMRNTSSTNSLFFIYNRLHSNAV